MPESLEIHRPLSPSHVHSMQPSAATHVPKTATYPQFQTYPQPFSDRSNVTLSGLERMNVTFGCVYRSAEGLPGGNPGDCLP